MTAVAACTICNAELALEALSRPGRVCPGCGGTRQSIELAAALLATVGRGVEPFLNRLTFAEPLRSARVLDLSGDLALAQVCWVVDGYRSGRHLREVPDGHLLARFDPVDLAAEAPGSADVLLLRDALFPADDLAAMLDAIAAALAPGGWAILQDRFAWPVPAATVPTAGDRMRPLGGGLSLPERQVIGADIVDAFAQRGVVAEFLRPHAGLDPLFRDVVLTALKPPALSPPQRS